MSSIGWRRPGSTPGRGTRARLDFAALAEKAEALVPQGRVRNIGYRFPEQVIVGMTPRKDAATGKPYELGFRQLFLDPWTGDELGRRTPGDLSQGRINLMTFIYLLHDALMLGPTGITILASSRSSGRSIASSASI